MYLSNLILFVPNEICFTLTFYILVDVIPISLQLNSEQGDAYLYPFWLQGIIVRYLSRFDFKKAEIHHFMPQ